jgi:menaquinone-dependent protoporphyrinogen oxidase
MNTAIVFASKYGTTEKVAGIIAEKLQETNKVELFSLNNNPNPDISGFEMVILGTSIYAGMPSKKMKTFCKKNETVLLQKKTALFICGMYPDKENQEKEFKTAYPEVLQNNAVATGFMGGAYKFELMNYFERLIIKKIAKTTTSFERIDEKAIETFIENILKP